MAAISSLKPTGTTPGEIAAAIARCAIAGRGALAEIDRLKAERVGFLLAGHLSQLDTNLADLTGAMGHATQISELIDELQQRETKAGPPPSVQPNVQAKAVEAAAVLAMWWSEHGAIVIGGVQLAVTALASIAAAAKDAPPRLRIQRRAVSAPRRLTQFADRRTRRRSAFPQRDGEHP